MPNFDGTTNTMLNTQRATFNLTERGYENDLSKINNANTNGLLQTYTNIFIRANNTNIGMIQSFNVSESRTVNKLQSIGVEGVIQSAPKIQKVEVFLFNVWHYMVKDYMTLLK
jgi:hypothetical protein